MIISKTPFRMSFFGGGTDYEEFYKEHNGSVISTTFDKYCYVNVRHLPRFFDYKSQLTYSKIEKVLEEKNFEHPLVRESMKYLDMHELSIIYDADLPARSGLGTSSSFAVGLLSAFYSLKGKYVDKEKLAKDAIYLERILCKEAGGIQDQIATAFGGFNRINFFDKGFSVHPIIISKERKKRLNSNLMLFFTGFSRFSSNLAMEQKKATGKKTKELLEMLYMVDEAEKILTNENINLNEFGKLLGGAWNLKKGITSNITTDVIEDIYRKAVKAGALGGKLLGAGAGGFLLFYVEQEKQSFVKSALNDLLYVPFEFEDEGTRILYYKSENYEPI